MLQAAFGFAAEALIARDQVGQGATFHDVHGGPGGAHHVHRPRPGVRPFRPIARLRDQFLVDLPFARSHQRVDGWLQFAARPAADLCEPLAGKEQSRALPRHPLNSFIPVRKRKGPGTVRNRKRAWPAPDRPLVRSDAVTPEPLSRRQGLGGNEDRPPQVGERERVRRVERRGRRDLQRVRAARLARHPNERRRCDLDQLAVGGRVRFLRCLGRCVKYPGGLAGLDADRGQQADDNRCRQRRKDAAKHASPGYQPAYNSWMGYHHSSPRVNSDLRRRIIA